MDNTPSGEESNQGGDRRGVLNHDMTVIDQIEG